MVTYVFIRAKVRMICVHMVFKIDFVFRSERAHLTLKDLDIMCTSDVFIKFPCIVRDKVAHFTEKS